MPTAVESPAAGTETVVLGASSTTDSWTASTDASWLHLSPDSQSGAGSTNVVFSFDANVGPTRVGTLVIAGQPLAVTQAGITYTPDTLVVTLVSNGLNYPQAIAVGASGNVCIADTDNNAIKMWNMTSNSLSVLIASGLAQPSGVAMDSQGNVYISDTGDNAIKEWVAASNTVITLFAGSDGSAGSLRYPSEAVLDSSGDLFVADTDDDEIWEFIPNSPEPAILDTVDYTPEGVAVDAAGNIYWSVESYVWEFISGQQLTDHVLTSGFNSVIGIAADGGGNIFCSDIGDNAIEEWVAASNSVVTRVAGLSGTCDVVVDQADNLFIADTYNNAIKELPRAFVDPTPKTESLFAGTDSLPPVLPTNENLLPPFAPTTDQPWLTITGITNGVITFAFTATTTNRTGHINLLGQSIPVTQAPPPLLLSATLTNGQIQLTFTNFQTTNFTILAATNLQQPLANWTTLGHPTNVSPDIFQFTDPAPPTNTQRYYLLRSP